MTEHHTADVVAQLRATAEVLPPCKLHGILYSPEPLLLGAAIEIERLREQLRLANIDAANLLAEGGLPTPDLRTRCNHGRTVHATWICDACLEEQRADEEREAARAQWENEHSYELQDMNTPKAGRDL